jgi:hypothetical protein
MPAVDETQSGFEGILGRPILDLPGQGHVFFALPAFGQSLRSEPAGHVPGPHLPDLPVLEFGLGLQGLVPQFLENPVRSRRQGQEGLPALFLVELPDHLRMSVGDQQLPFHPGLERQPSPSGIQIRQHHVPFYVQVELGLGMLGSPAALPGLHQGSLEGELVGFQQGHAPVSGNVPGASQGAHQVMGEKGALQELGLLGILVFGAGGDENRALAFQLLFQHERLHQAGPLEARDGSALAGIQDADAQFGRDLIDALLQVLQGIGLLAQLQVVVGTVAGEIEEEHHLIAGPDLGAQGMQLAESLIQVFGPGGFEKDEIILVHAAHILEKLGHLLGVGFGVLEADIGFKTAIVADHQADAEDLGRGLAQAQGQQHGQRTQCHIFPRLCKWKTDTRPPSGNASPSKAANPDRSRPPFSHAARRIFPRSADEAGRGVQKPMTASARALPSNSRAKSRVFPWPAGDRVFSPGQEKQTMTPAASME